MQNAVINVTSEMARYLVKRYYPKAVPHLNQIGYAISLNGRLDVTPASDDYQMYGLGRTEGAAWFDALRILVNVRENSEIREAVIELSSKPTI